MTREEAMRRHPSWVQDRQDDEACDLANRYSRLDEWHHDWSTRSRWTDEVEPVAGIIGLYLLIVGAAAVGEMVGGWPT